jgi:ankyrin repeat protein
MPGVVAGCNQLRLALTVSPAGEVVNVEATGDDAALKFWPSLQAEVRQWKFVPFEQNGNAVTADVEEYLDLVPPERLPKKHVAAPVLTPNSRVSISLRRSGCLGSPAYTVKVSTSEIVFDGGFFVVAQGKHTAGTNAKKVRDLAKRFVAADFYSMDDKYVASVTDNPAYVLSVDIDGHAKEVEDYVGQWVGMPAVIRELEDGVDAFATTERWINGGEGLVQALQAERFNFQSQEVQTILKEAASRGQSETVHELVSAGVPLDPLPAPKTGTRSNTSASAALGLLTAAGGNLGALQVLLDAGVSRNNQSDKDLALLSAAQSGNLQAVRRLIAFGANPNADFSNASVTDSTGTVSRPGKDVGNVLISAALSGNPDVVREILQYHPNLEARDREGKTAVFAAGEYLTSDKEGARVECVRLLAQAGANVNARDNDGNTPLHEILLTDVEEELLKLGPNVNARNNDGETPIFTNVDDDSMSLFIEHGADLNIRNSKGETVVDAAAREGPARQAALRKALEKLVQS